MKWFRQRVLSREILGGTFINLGSSITAEIAGRSGLDWVLIDLEHGSGDFQALLHQAQALEGTPAAPIVRIVYNEPWWFKRILDTGVSGLMIPQVATVEEAQRAASAMRYSPQGTRGVARFNRACGYSLSFEEYFSKANDNLVTVVQIESPEGVKNAEAIAAVDGVDVLFVGPFDLSVAMGLPMQFSHPNMTAAMQRVAQVCKQKGKVAGTLLSTAEQAEPLMEMGYTLLALGSDGSAVATGMKAISETFKKAKSERAR